MSIEPSISPPNGDRNRRTRDRICLFLILCVGALMFPLQFSEYLSEKGGILGSARNSKKAFAKYWSKTDLEEQNESNSGRIQTIEGLRQVSAKLKNDVMEKLKAQLELEYGEYANAIFDEHNVMRYSDVSKDRFERRLMRKILSPAEEDKVFHWVTGGHSAAAAHGNLYEQSYTHVLREIASGAFEAVGLQLVAENYAMGGQRSAPEICYCMQEIYGTSMDVLSWDFGMTDGRDFSKLACWGARSSMLPSRPVLALIDGMEPRYQTLKTFEDLAGMTVFQMNADTLSSFISKTVPTERANVTLASGLHKMVCDMALENNGDCNNEKYNTAESCGTKRVKGQASWHPGWKVHRVRGIMLGYFLVSSLSNAIDQLVLKAQGMKLNEIYIELETQHAENDHRSSTHALNATEHLLSKMKAEDENMFRILGQIYSSSHSNCRVTLRPNRARYEGIMNDDNIKGNFWGGYHEGVDLESVRSRDGLPDESIFPLVRNNLSKDFCTNGTQIDFIDYWYLRGADGWLTMGSFPNESEEKAFGNAPNRGYIHACTYECEWNRCGKGEIQLKELMQSVNNTSPPPLDIEINGVRVSDVQESSTFCSLLGNGFGSRGLIWERDNSGKFNIRIRINDPKSYLRLTSVVVINA